MSLRISVSTVTDGSMKSPDRDFHSVLAARTAFLQQRSVDPADTTLVNLTYETDDFCRYETLTDELRGDGIVRAASIETDAVVVTKPGHALFLPLADCIGAVIHDPTTNTLMLSHLGRHNLDQSGGTACINYLIDRHGIDPNNLTVWLSPAAGKNYYPLYAFDNRSLHDVATEQLVATGVRPQNISASSIDSAADNNYFSHSQYLKDNRKTDGRYAIVALMN